MHGTSPPAGYLSEDGFYFARGGLLPLKVRSQCPHHKGVEFAFDMFPCCCPDPPYGVGSWDERVQRAFPSASEAAWIANEVMATAASIPEVKGMEITTMRWETRGGQTHQVPLPMEHRDL